MSKESIVVFLGVIVLFAPHIGIPEEWRAYLLSGVGVLLVFFGYSLRRAAFHRRLERSSTERGTDSFTESSGAPEITPDAVS